MARNGEINVSGNPSTSPRPLISQIEITNFTFNASDVVMFHIINHHYNYLANQGAEHFYFENKEMGLIDHIYFELHSF